MKTLDKIFAWTLVVLGCVHAGATFVAYHRLGFESIWFFAGGVAIIAGGLLNLNRIQSSAGMARVSSVAINVLVALLCVAIVWVMGFSFLHAPQVIAVIVAVVAELIFSVRQ